MAKPLNALIVEDSEDDAALVVLELRRARFDVCSSCVGTAAAMRDALAKEPWDVVISDYSMPHFSGIDALKILHESGLDLPFILVSGVAGEEQCVEAMRLGAHDYLMKKNLPRLAPAVERELREAGVRKARRLADDRFRILLDCAPDAIVVVDEHSQINLVNAQAEKLFAYTRGELIGQPIEILLPADVRERHARHRSAYGQAPRVRPMGPGLELQGLRKGGEPFPAEVSLSPIETAEGTWVAAGVRDITERRAAEKLLQAERQRAEEASRAKSDFLAAMSHEIRTPMNSILGMADLLSETQLGAEQRQFVEASRRAGSALMTLIDDILDFSKIESGHFELERAQFDLEDVVDQVAELLGVKARGKNVALLARLAPGVTRSLIGDSSRLRQVLINLVGNALKFTESGHVLLTVQNADAGPGHVAFAISDTGIGMEPEQLSLIFDDFRQADGSITRKYGGTGLGLAISRRLVHRMGGELTVASTAGQGSTFSFTVPFGIGPGQPPEPSREWTGRSGHRAMIVDPSALSGFILRESLSAWNLDAVVFERPEDALAELAQRPAYAVAIVGHGAPAIDGFALRERIRELAPDLPVVMLSSDGTVDEVKRSSEARMAGYALKPVKRAELLRLISQAIQPSQQTQGASNSVPAESPAGPALKILIVEDSADNQMLVKAYLRGSPHEIVFAHDGAAAIEAFEKSRFDLILMDLQMPRMDGLTATRHLRALEGERGLARVPIVALSANAFPEDFERSRSAGCDAHISKPFSRRTLFAAIEDYGLKQVQASARVQPPDAGCPEPLVVQPPDGFEEITARYVAARRAELPRLLELAKDRDFAKIRFLGHDMKGTGGAYGIAALTTVGAAIEAAAIAADAETLAAQLDTLGRLLERVRVGGQSLDGEAVTGKP